MKIAVISSTVFPCPPTGYAGLEMVAWQQAKGLASRGHEVALIAPDGSSCPGVNIIPFGPPSCEKAPQGGFFITEQEAYKRYWQALVQFDAIVDNSWQAWSYCLKAEGVLKAPVLRWFHAPVNTMVQSWPPRFHVPSASPQGYDDVTVEKACPVCISKDQANHFEALFNRPARFCHNAVDLDFYKPLDVPRSKRFLFLGRFSTIKGPLLAIQACKEAGVGLDLIGDTTITGEPEYFQKCKDLADGEQIRIVGGMPRGQTVWWYSQAHAMLHPVRDFREPFGLAPVEAQACGCPVIAWDNGAMRETVRADSGRLVRSMDQLIQAVKDFSNLNSPGQIYQHGEVDRARCRDNATQFSEENQAAKVEALCKEAVETGGW